MKKLCTTNPAPNVEIESPRIIKLRLSWFVTNFVHMHRNVGGTNYTINSTTLHVNIMISFNVMMVINFLDVMGVYVGLVDEMSNEMRV